MNRVFPWVLGFREDVRFSMRQFQRAPAYAVFTVMVLALGIGTVVAIFTISYGVLLKPLPFRADRQLYEAVERDTKGEEDLNASYAEIMQWQQATKNSADVGFAWGEPSILDAPPGAELISEVAASPNLFSVLGVQPMAGRVFSATEQISDHPDVVVLSYAMWQQSFAGDRSVLGKTVHIAGVQHTIIGIMPKGFEYPVDEHRIEVWVPLERSTLTPAGNDPYGAPFTPLVHLHAGVRPEAVEAEVANVHAQFVKRDRRREIHLVGLRDLLVQNVQPALFALEIAVSVVWLIACSNVAGLLLARVAARRTEIAVRSALGAGRRRILAQFLTESLLLSAAGAAGGLGLAMLMLHVFRHMLANILPLAQNIQMNWAVWLCLVALTLVTALAFGTVPALLAAWTGAQAGLRSSGRKHSGDRGQNRMRSALLVGEVALSIALLIGAGLMMRTMSPCIINFY